MNRYIAVNQIDDKTLENIRISFEKKFHFDLREALTQHKSLEEAWNFVLSKCFGTFHIRSLKDCLSAIDNAINGLENDGIIRVDTDSYEYDENRKKTRFCNFISEFQKMPSNGYLLEEDAWIDAYFTLSYLQNFDKKSGEKQNRLSLENGCYDKNRKEGTTIIRFPFSHNLDSDFCKRYLDYFLNESRITVFETAIDPQTGEQYSVKDAFSTYDGSSTAVNENDSEQEYSDSTLNLDAKMDCFCHEVGCLDYDAVKVDKDYSRWNYQKIHEYNKQFTDLEDQILFTKTFGNILTEACVRSMYKFQSTGIIWYLIPFLSHMCGFHSITWQVLASYMYIRLFPAWEYYSGKDIWGNILVMFEAWKETGIYITNKMLKTLTQGLIYLFCKGTNMSNDFSVFEPKCKHILSRWNNIISIDTEDFLKEISAGNAHSQKYRLSKTILQNPKDLGWTYAILQRFVIDISKNSRENTGTPKYANFQTENGKIIKIPFFLPED